ncbi:MAG: hypothetical protein AAFP22_04890, partial [Planctomycetota bacterium]
MGPQIGAIVGREHLRSAHAVHGARRTPPVDTARAPLPARDRARSPRSGGELEDRHAGLLREEARTVDDG